MIRHQHPLAPGEELQEPEVRRQNSEERLRPRGALKERSCSRYDFLLFPLAGNDFLLLLAYRLFGWPIIVSLQH